MSELLPPSPPPEGWVTPTTQDVRYAWAMAGYDDMDFRWWLAAHDAEVREQIAADIHSLLDNSEGDGIVLECAKIARGGAA